MKVLTLNFLTCAVKACKSSTASFPLHPKDAELVQDTIKLNPKLLVNILPRIDWNALITTSSEVRIPFRTRIHSLRKPYLFPIFEAVLPTQFSLLPYVEHPADYFTDKKLGFPALPATPPTGEELEKDEKMMKELHVLLMETQINEGKLVCGNCGFEYPVKEGVANFLLPNHLV